MLADANAFGELLLRQIKAVQPRMRRPTNVSPSVLDGAWSWGRSYEKVLAF